MAYEFVKFVSIIDRNQQNSIINELRSSEPKLIGIFGSFARGDFNMESDIDILFAPTKPIGLFKLSSMKRSLEKELKRKVDLITQGSLSPLISEQISNQLNVIYKK